MGHLQPSLFLASLDQDPSIELVVGSTTDGLLLDQQLQAVVAGRAEVDLFLALFTHLQRQERVSQRLATQRNHIHISLGDIPRAINQQGTVVAGDSL